MLNNLKNIFVLSIALIVSVVASSINISTNAQSTNSDVVLESVEVESTNKDGSIDLKIKQKKNHARTTKFMKLSKEQVKAFEEGEELLSKTGEIKPSGISGSTIRAIFSWLKGFVSKGWSEVQKLCWGNSWLTKAFNVNSCWEVFTSASCAFFGKFC